MYKTNTLWEADDMLYKNAHIFTENGFASGAFAVEDGRFADILPGYDGAADVDLNQAAVIPGLIDVHNHGNSGLLPGRERHYVFCPGNDDASV